METSLSKVPVILPSFCLLLASSLMNATPVYTLETPEFGDSNLLAWKKATFREVASNPERHTIHSYFNTCPESPDGKYVLFFASTHPAAEKGELYIVERATGKETLLASNITTEDAHRVACQQWSAGGRKVVFHDLREDHWVVVAVDVATGKEMVLARDRQLGFGAVNDVWVPIYGCHWNPGEHRNLEFVNVDTGEIRVALRIEDVVKEYGVQIGEVLPAGEYSIFFPVVSPDSKRVFFKISLPSGTQNFRSSQASKREGKVVYDLEQNRFLRFYKQWGHPSWSPDSNGIFEKGNVLTTLESNRNQAYAPLSPSDHPSLSPEMDLFVTDADVTRRPGANPGEWGIIIGSLQSNEFVTIHRFLNTKGANSWRRNHPHPHFSADGKRIYFNTNSGEWTRLYVAELPSESK